MDEKEVKNQIPDEEEMTNKIMKYDLAIERGKVPFAYLVQSYFYMQEKFNDDQIGRELCENYYPKLHRIFYEKEPIKESNFCTSKVGCAVILTENNDLYYTVYNADISMLKFLSTFDRIKIKAHQFLKEIELTTCMEMLYGIIGNVMNLIDERELNKSSDEDIYFKMLDFLEKELAGVEEYILRSAQRRVTVQYFSHMLFGLIIVGAESIVVGVSLYLLHFENNVIAIFAGSIIAGGVGAIVSVMTRTSSGHLYIDHEAGDAQIKWLGRFRPIVGSILGVFLNIVVLGGFLSMGVPTDLTIKLYFSLGLAFIAGFSERWAQDILSIASKGLAETKDDEKKKTLDNTQAEINKIRQDQEKMLELLQKRQT